YTDRIRYLMRSVALGRAPEGFVEGPLPKAVARMGELVAIPDTRYSGSSFDIYKYRVENVSKDVLELDERAFFTESVRAVAIFPNAILEQGQATNIFVLADKTQLQGN